jgi:hypothetical protein
MTEPSPRYPAASSPAPARLGQLLALLALVTAVTALSLGIDLLLPTVFQSGLQQNAVRLVVLAFIVYGAWLGLTRAHFAGRARVTAWLLINIPLLAWQSLIWWLALDGAFQTRGGALLLPAAIVLPVVIGLPVLLRSAAIGRLLDATPPAWLVGLQVYRGLGSGFLASWIIGTLAGRFAVPAGVGDMLVGILALPVALLLHRGVRGARGLAAGWNVLGILDLVNAVTLGVLTAAAPVAYPLVLIPAFAVPLSLLLHAVSLRQLRRLALGADDVARATPARQTAVRYSPATPLN